MPGEKVVLINLETSGRAFFSLTQSCKIRTLLSAFWTLVFHVILFPSWKFTCFFIMSPVFGKTVRVLPRKQRGDLLPKSLLFKEKMATSVKRLSCFFQWAHWPVFSPYPLCNRWVADWWRPFPQGGSTFPTIWGFDRLLSGSLYLVGISSVFLILKHCSIITISKRQKRL